MDIKKEVRDQGAHVAAAILIFAPFLLLPCFLTAMWVGFGMGMVREITEEGKPVTLAKAKAALGSKLDLACWTLGALLAYLLFA